MTATSVAWRPAGSLLRCPVGASHGRQRTIRRSAASAARSPLSQAPSIVPHSVSWVASPARYMQPIGSVRIFREACAPGAAATSRPAQRAARSSASRLISLRPRRPRCRTALSAIPPRTPPSPARPAPTDRGRTSPRHRSCTAMNRHIGIQQRGPRRIALLDDDVVAGQAERIARHLQRDAVVTAETQFGGGIERALGNIGREFDVARSQHIARYRDDGGARGDLAGQVFPP